MNKHEQILFDNNRYVSYYSNTMVFFYLRQNFLNQLKWWIKDELIGKIEVLPLCDTTTDWVKDET